MSREETRSGDARTQELWRETQWLRDLLTRVAEDLERLASENGRNAADRAVLLGRAGRIRERMHAGPPQGWFPVRLGGMPGEED